MSKMMEGVVGRSMSDVARVDESFLEHVFH
jgi:hypothetical protein